MAGVAAVMLAVAAVGLAALGLEGVVRRMFKRRAVDDRGRAERVIVDAREPAPAPPEDPPEWERVTREPWGDAVTEEIDRIKDEEAGVPEQDEYTIRPGGDASAGYAQSTVTERDAGHALPAPARGVRVDCRECAGKGFVVKSVNDLLGESLALLGDAGDSVVTEFYRRLVDADNGKDPADQLASLFPPDLLTDDRVKGQRDKLLKALIALSKWYQPDDPGALEGLDTALAAYGRSHAPFIRPDGQVRGATLQEYASVQSVLLGTLHDAAGAAWRPEYDRAWAEAFDYAAAKMMAEQHRVTITGEFTMGRMPREARGAGTT